MLSNNVPKDTVQTILKRLQSYHPKTIDLGLDRCLALLEKCGNPHLHLSPTIHVAGTNGKGSVLSFLQSICESAELSVHRYTSPELIHFNERFIVSGTQVSDDMLCDALLYVERQNDGASISFFEITTVAGLYMFATHPADIVLLETGMGGRLDATNVIRNPIATVITCIGLDHQDFLGDTVEKIALEKAGIFKDGTPAVFAPQPHHGACDVLTQRADIYTAVTSPTRLQDGFVYDGVVYPNPSLVGEHQYDNCATAIATVPYVPFDISHAQICHGITTATHRGRFETLHIHGKTIYVDGGHNADAGQALAKVLHAQGIHGIPMICGMLHGKDTQGFFAPLKPYVNQVYTVPIRHNPFATADGIPPHTLAQTIADLGFSTTPCDSIHHALSLCGDTVLCTGSLHVVGDVLGLES